MLFARVAVEKTIYRFDDAFDYGIPDKFQSILKPGMRVLVPFGRGNTKRVAFVLELSHTTEVENIKFIHAVLDKAPLLHSELIKLVPWLSERTFCTLYDAVRTILPSGIHLKKVTSYKTVSKVDGKLLEKLTADERQIYDYLSNRNAFVKQENLYRTLGLKQDCTHLEEMFDKNVLERQDETLQQTNDATLRMARIALESSELEARRESLTKKQQSVVILLEETGASSIKEMCYYLGITVSVLSTLEKHGIIETFEVDVYRTPEMLAEKDEDMDDILLTSEQEEAFRGLSKALDDDYNVSLLYGVTGSGKTQVFLKLIERVLAKGKTALVMVPEIALTPQTVSIFQTRFGDKVATFHSALSIGERMDEFKRVSEGKATIVVGTRSAVFAPLQNIGLIVMDEEQEASYKSERTPRYHARDVAQYRCAYHKASLVLVSATPSIETYAMAKAGKYNLFEINERYGKAVLPEVMTVDMREQLMLGGSGAISVPLLEELKNTLEAGKQAILLMNRRGYQTFLACQSCGEVVMCPHCSISLTYHVANGRLMCHYCGYSKRYTTLCEHCDESSVSYAGFGTQRIEEELKENLPDARVLRMDADTTNIRYAHEKAFEQFAKKEYDILLGTQMVAKGLDFENVTLVGIIDADQQLYNDDYRSLERTFALLTQVIGRSGRGEHKGKALIQTMTPENPVIELARKQDYKGFYDIEIETRRLMTYPPFCALCLVGFMGNTQKGVKGAAETLLSLLIKQTQTTYKDIKVMVLGPMPSRIERAHDKYRYQLTIKTHNTKRFREMMSHLMREIMNTSEYRNVIVFADINPLGTF